MLHLMLADKNPHIPLHSTGWMHWPPLYAASCRSSSYRLRNKSWGVDGASADRIRRALSLQRSPSPPKLHTLLMLMLFIFSYPSFASPLMRRGETSFLHFGENALTGAYLQRTVFNSDPESGPALMQQLCPRRGQGTPRAAGAPLPSACNTGFLPPSFKLVLLC